MVAWLTWVVALSALGRLSAWCPLFPVIPRTIWHESGTLRLGSYPRRSMRHTIKR